MNLDLTILYSLNHLIDKSRFLDQVFLFGARYLIFFIILSVFLLWFSKIKVARKIAIFALFSAITGIIFSKIITLFYFKERPFVAHNINLLFPYKADASFPSDHAVFAFSIAFFIFFFNKKLGWFLLTLAFIVGLSRVIAGLHYPSDILGGAGLGFLSACLSYTFYKKFLK